LRTLPAIVDRENQYRWGLAAFLFCVALYAVTNAMQRRPPYELVPGVIDEAMPLMPATVWVYSSYVAISVAAYVMERNVESLNRFIYAQLTANVVSAVIFLVWPTTFLRPELPSSGGISTAALHFVWLVDEPVNCFPSLHVSSSALAALMMWRRGGVARGLFVVWALAIALSTMTTKQHHVFDVVGGVVLAGGLSWLFFGRVTLAPKLVPRARSLS
jgi:membrane-associated phospholipid phosphatase